VSTFRSAPRHAHDTTPIWSRARQLQKTEGAGMAPLARLALLAILLLPLLAPRAALADSTIFNRTALLAGSVDEGPTNSLRMIVQRGGPLARDARTPLRRFPSPVVVCPTSGCVRAVSDRGADLGGACENECMQLGGRITGPFSLVGGSGGNARYFEFATTWPANRLFTNV
jgi:hypothetical protein